MKKIKIILLLLLPHFIFAQVGFINNGARMVVGEGTKVEISGSGANYINNSANSQNGNIELYGTMQVGGTWINNSTTQNVFTQFGPNAEILFNGNNDQSIGGTMATSFPNLDINNYVVLNQDFYIQDNLNLNNGVLDIGNYDLIINNLVKLTSSTGFSENAMIVADGSGSILLSVPATGEYYVPVGTNNGSLIFSPIDFKFLSGTFNNSHLAINAYNLKHLQNQSTTDYLNRYWSVENTGISNFLCRIEFTYNNDDIVGNANNIYGGIWNNNSWVLLNKIQNNLIIDTLNYFGDVTGIRYSTNSVENANNLKIEMYFANNNLTINSNAILNNVDFCIYNSIGQIIESGKIDGATSTSLQLNVESGIYFIKLSSKDFNYSKKFYLN